MYYVNTDVNSLGSNNMILVIIIVVGYNDNDRNDKWEREKKGKKKRIDLQIDIIKSINGSGWLLGYLSFTIIR